MRNRHIHIFTINYFSEYLDQFVEAIIKQDYPYPVVLHILDNSGELKSNKYAQLATPECQIEILLAPHNLGFGRGHNYLFKQSLATIRAYDWLVIANNDLGSAGCSPSGRRSSRWPRSLGFPRWSGPARRTCCASSDRGSSPRPR